jgi:hypothetical protein
MSQPGTIDYLVGKLDMLRIECDQCDRHGRYSVTKLVAKYGPDAKLTALIVRCATCSRRESSPASTCPETWLGPGHRKISGSTRPRMTFDGFIETESRQHPEVST